MKFLENLELVAVEYDEKQPKAVLTFLDAENGEIREVNFNKNVYDQPTGKFVPDAEKAQKVEEWCKEYFGLSFDDLGQAVGDHKDIYCYDNFNSLFEVSMVQKFDEDMLGQILSVEVTEVVDDGKAVKIRFEYEGETYESKMTYSTYLEARKEWFVNPQKQSKQYAKFTEKFHIAIADKEQLVGKTVMVEVKKAMGKFIYNEIKPFPKKKK
jgi:hypothetical protein